MKAFDSLVNDILRERWASSPVTATFDGMHESDHLLDTFAPGYLAQVAAQRQKFLKALDAIHDEHLDLSRRIDKRVLIGALNASINDLTVVKQWSRDPGVYLQTGLYGIYILLARTFAPEKQRVESAILRAEAFPRLLQEAKDNIKVCPRVLADTARAVAGGAKAFFTGPYLATCRSHDGDRAEQSAGACVQALDDLMQHIESVWLPTADDSFAIGREAFAAKLKYDHGLPYTPEQLLEIGENARRDAVAQLEALAEKIEPGTPWPELIERFKDTHPSAEGLLEAYRSELHRAREFVAQRELVTLPPDERLEVVETPEFDRPTTPYAALMPPAPFEHDQRSFFYVTPVEEGPDVSANLKEHSSYSIPVTALHEAYPGHHLQLVLSNRGTSLVRKVYSTNVFVEGWALYCEEMMYETGFYPDSATRLFQLKDLLWRACRVILDVRLHTGAISPEAAVNYLATEAFLDRSFAQAEVNRYCATPTQPMSYLIGRREILRLRQELQTLIHGKFSLRQFHDELLAWGSIPIAYVREGLVSNPAFAKAA
jgi:uncharacterized protein (DUF885 family)